MVDDHPVVIDGLQRLLGQRDDMEIISSFETGGSLLQGLERNVPDVLILDIKLPDITSTELMAQLQQNHPQVKILVLTYLDNLYYVKTMMRQGALGYVLKTAGMDVLLTAITTVAKGEQYLEEIIKEKLVQHALISKKESKREVFLTKREKEVLQLIASNLSSQQIADKLFLSLKTIEFHRSNLLMKLNAKNAATLVKRAMQMSLLD